MVLQDGSTMTLSEKETRKMILNFQPTKHFQKGDAKLTKKKGGFLFLRMLTKGLKAEQWHQIVIPFSTIFALSCQMTPPCASMCHNFLQFNGKSNKDLLISRSILSLRRFLYFFISMFSVIQLETN